MHPDGFVGPASIECSLICTYCALIDKILRILLEAFIDIVSVMTTLPHYVVYFGDLGCCCDLLTLHFVRWCFTFLPDEPPPELGGADPLQARQICTITPDKTDRFHAG